jgi:hypothetical protein
MEIAVANLKYKSRGSDEIPAKLIQAGGEYQSLRSISSLILFGIRKNCLITGRSTNSQKE